MINVSPVLSICIPTYNRADYIGETLESIARQVTAEVEVVIADNASTDNTSEIVESFRSRLPHLVYSRSATNEGFAANFFRAASLASGEYAWLLGSDDIVGPGMLRRALEELASGDSLYIYDRTETDRELTPRRLDAVLDDAIADRRFELPDRATLLRYFQHSRSIASLFSFISSVIFRRSEWDAVEVKSAWLECSFPHAIRMWGMLAAGGTLTYVPAPLVLARLENDTFNPGDMFSVRRLMMNYHGYRMIRDEYWSRDPDLREAMNAVMRRTHPVAGLLKLRRIVKDHELDELCACLRDFGYGRVFSWLYGTESCRRFVVSLKQLYVRLGLSPELAAG